MRILWNRIKFDKTYVTHTHIHAHSDLQYLMGFGTPEQSLTDRCHKIWLPRHCGGKEGKGESPKGGFSMHSTGQLGGRSCQKVDWCYSCTHHSTCATLGPSSRAYDC